MMDDLGDRRVVIDVRGQDAAAALEREELRAALAERPRRIPSKHFYDRHGSELFEAITRLPGYYLTSAETALLAARAGELAASTGAEALVELGPGAARKTRLLLDALDRAGTLRRYVPVDVSASMMQRIAEELGTLYPGLEVRGLVADFLRHLPELPHDRRSLVAFLGSTIGNLEPAAAAAFLGRVAAGLGAGDAFLLGIDLIKQPSLLEAAYNDAEGVTAAFNRNILLVVNRRFGADFDPERFAHRAVWNAAERWIEMRLASRAAQRVRIEALDLDLDLAAGEEILTEISAKYDRASVEAMLGEAGMALVEWIVDGEGLFALALAERR